MTTGFAGGALFGAGFAFCAWLTKPGPDLVSGIAETWWFFAVMGSIMHPVSMYFDSYEGMRYVAGSIFKGNS